MINKKPRRALKLMERFIDAPLGWAGAVLDESFLYSLSLLDRGLAGSQPSLPIDADIKRVPSSAGDMIASELDLYYTPTSYEHKRDKPVIKTSFGWGLTMFFRYSVSIILIY